MVGEIFSYKLSAPDAEQETVFTHEVEVAGYVFRTVVVGDNEQEVRRAVRKQFKQTHGKSVDIDIKFLVEYTRVKQ